MLDPFRVCVCIIRAIRKRQKEGLVKYRQGKVSTYTPHRTPHTLTNKFPNHIRPTSVFTDVSRLALVNPSPVELRYPTVPYRGP